MTILKWNYVDKSVERNVQAPFKTLWSRSLNNVFLFMLSEMNYNSRKPIKY